MSAHSKRQANKWVDLQQQTGQHVITCRKMHVKSVINVTHNNKSTVKADNLRRHGRVEAVIRWKLAPTHSSVTPWHSTATIANASTSGSTVQIDT